MKILVLINVYPPHAIGGYELACHEIVECLKAAGHRVAVLTSSYGVAGSEGSGQKPEGRRRLAVPGCLLASAFWLLPSESAVYRLLHYRSLPPFCDTTPEQSAAMTDQDVRAMRRVLAIERPNLIYVWNMGGLTRSLLSVANAHRAPVVFEIGDDWLTRPPHASEGQDLRDPSASGKIAWRLTRLTRRWAGCPTPANLSAMDLRHVIFKSQWLKRSAVEGGLPVEHAPVIYRGVNRAIFRPSERPHGRHRGSACRILYVGRLERLKGVHTVIEAFARLAHDPAHAGLSLTIRGDGLDPPYAAELREAVQTHALSDRVRFLGWVSRYDLPATYNDHDILIFPTLYEGFGLTQIEAMACGLPVIGTGAGGSAEALTEETALRFPPGNAALLAERIAALAADPGLRRRMGEAAVRRVARQFDLEDSVRRTVEYLDRVISRQRPAASPERDILTSPH